MGALPIGQTSYPHHHVMVGFLERLIMVSNEFEPYTFWLGKDGVAPLVLDGALSSQSVWSVSTWIKDSAPISLEERVSNLEDAAVYWNERVSNLERIRS
jgi:hypothetical protein